MPVLYLERRPGGPLAGFVQMMCYARAGELTHRRERMLPNGCVQVVVNLAQDFLLDCREAGSDGRMPPALVVGARSIYEIIDSSDLTELIGVLFAPSGFAGFARDAADLLANRTVPLEDGWRAPAKSLRDRLMELPTPETRLDALERFLTEHFAGRLVRNPMVDFALGRFERAPGVATVREAARSTGWSERRFSQVFRETVGLTPKTWCRVQRFQRAVRELYAGAEVRWAELALECGYYDQSHFANEFRAFSGVDATTYTAKRTHWIDHIAED